MESESIDKTCQLCGSEANGRIKGDKQSIEICHDCAKDMLWVLIHDEYSFSKGD